MRCARVIPGLMCGLALSSHAAALAKTGDDPLPRAIAEFSADLEKVVLSNPRNGVISPLSIELALAMVREGARGETAAEMDRTLRLDALAAPGALSSAVASLTDRLDPRRVDGKLQKDAVYRFALANAVWVQDGFTLESAYRNAIQSKFRAGVSEIDFTDTDDARDEINEWIDDHTKGGIEELLGDDLPTPDTVMMLVNAVHLFARWQHPFESNDTKLLPFHVEPNVTANVKTMYAIGEFDYAETDRSVRVTLPYEAGALEMVIVVPKPGRALSDLSAEEFAGRVGTPSPRTLELFLPRFEFEQRTDLRPVLIGLGMRQAFVLGGADFSGISKRGGLAIGAVVHGARIRVDEEGTEASAATAVSMLKGMPARPEGLVVVRVDRPFVFRIQHRSSGALLFVGRVQDPRGS